MVRFLLAWAAFASFAWGCSCFKTPAPCSDMAAAADVVTGEVVNRNKPLEFHIRVIEVLKGELKPGDMAPLLLGAGGGDMPLGTRLILFRETGKEFRVECCGPTTDLDGYEHWLWALRNAAKGGGPVIAGTVYSVGGSHERGPLGGVKVMAECGGQRGVGLTNEKGQFEIGGMGEGECSVQTEKPGYLDGGLWFGSKVPMIRGCAVPWLQMYSDGQISGRVSFHNGRPAPGVVVQAYGFDKDGTLGESALQESKADEYGRYSIRKLPEGRYVVGVNAGKYYDSGAVPLAVWPNGSSRESAGRITLGAAEKRSAVDFEVAEPREPVEVSVQFDAPEMPQQGEPFLTVRETEMGRTVNENRHVKWTDGAARLTVWRGRAYQFEITRLSKLGVFDGKTGPVEIRGPGQVVTVTLQQRH